MMTWTEDVNKDTGYRGLELLQADRTGYDPGIPTPLPVGVHVDMTFQHS